MANFDPKIDSLHFPGPSENPENNVVTMSKQSINGLSFELASIDAGELAIFKAQFADLMMLPGSDERKIMIDRVQQYLIAMRAIKSALNNPHFTGIYPGDTELGMGFLRPQFTRSNAAFNLNWSVTLAAANTWQDWLYETAGNAFNVGQDFGFITTHLKSFTSPIPLTTETKFQVGRTQFVPLDTRNLQLADSENDIPIEAIPTLILIPKSTFYTRIRGDISIGAENIALGGLVFGLGRVLKQEVASWT
jgi:hypothetical protein